MQELIEELEQVVEAKSKGGLKGFLAELVKDLKRKVQKNKRISKVEVKHETRDMGVGPLGEVEVKLEVNSWDVVFEILVDPDERVISTFEIDVIGEWERGPSSGGDERGEIFKSKDSKKAIKWVLDTIEEMIEGLLGLDQAEDADQLEQELIEYGTQRPDYDSDFQVKFIDDVKDLLKKWSRRKDANWDRGGVALKLNALVMEYEKAKKRAEQKHDNDMHDYYMDGGR